MTAIITDSLKTEICRLLLNDFDGGSSQYYVGIGKSDQYSDAGDTIINPVQTLKEEREFRSNLQSIKKVTDTSLVVPRYNWTSGTKYSGYSDSTVGIPTNTYYVLTENNHVYICLQAGAGFSTVQPNYADASQNSSQDIKRSFQTGDGYRWKYLYELSASKVNSFLSASFMPVQKIGSPIGSAETDQKTVQDNAQDGQIVGFIIDSGGEGHSTVTVEVVGDFDVQATVPSPTVVNGSITAISTDSAHGGGRGYTIADVVLTDASPGNVVKPAKIRPVIASQGGLGADAAKDLKAKSIMFNTQPSGAEGGAFITTNDFRQIGLFKNMKNTSNSVISTNAEKALRILTLDGTGNVAVDDPVTAGSGPTFAKAFVDEIDGANNKILIHQNSRTGFNKFPSSGNITASGGTQTIQSAETNSTADRNTGDLLYIENRAAVLRTGSQTEDIKVIITM